MAIKRRTFSNVVSEDDPVSTEELAETEKVAQEANILIAPREPDTTHPPSRIEAMRKVTFLRGSAGQQPHPKDVDTQQLLDGVQYVQNTDEFARIEKFYRDRIRSPLTAIRAFVVLAEGGPKKANDDTGTASPLWAFRNGTNPFYGKFKNENEEADDDDA